MGVGQPQVELLAFGPKIRQLLLQRRMETADGHR
jgi:hypothetical protein